MKARSGGNVQGMSTPPPAGAARAPGSLHALHWPAPGPRVVLVHGMVVASRAMVPLAGELHEAGMAVWAPDLPGFGASPRPARALSVDELADALAAWIASAGLGGAALVGNSFGTQVSAAVAARHPETVGRLVLFAPTIDARWRSRRGYAMVARRPSSSGGPERRRRCPSLARRAATRLLTPTTLDAGHLPSLRWLVASEYSMAGPRLVAATYRASMADRIEDRLPEITVPVLVARGSGDSVASPSWARSLAGLAPRGTYAEVPGADHDGCYRQAAGVAAAVVPFLAVGGQTPVTCEP